MISPASDTVITVPQGTRSRSISRWDKRFEKYGLRRRLTNRRARGRRSRVIRAGRSHSALVCNAFGSGFAPCTVTAPGNT